MLLTLAQSCSLPVGEWAAKTRNVRRAIKFVHVFHLFMRTHDKVQVKPGEHTKVDPGAHVPQGSYAHTPSHPCDVNEKIQ